MLIEIGHVEAIFRYPVKSMGGERLEAANLGWHGLDGARRLASRRSTDRSGVPWLTAGQPGDLSPVGRVFGRCALVRRGGRRRRHYRHVARRSLRDAEP